MDKRAVKKALLKVTDKTPDKPALVALPATDPSGGEDFAASNAQLLADDSEFVMRPWSGAGEPLPIVEGRGCYVRDADGKEYADFTSGYFVNQAGHSHPAVIDAAIDQLRKVSQVSGRH